ncbi:hypothetical protein IQ07DRAFT_362005 [Pyrenochaeta sp. DS3sAY3a]|nr:hypothetical protein IQ07DRAFT_362005 [Pyrenochaeta sp. DS3sAY3a]
METLPSPPSEAEYSLAANFSFLHSLKSVVSKRLCYALYHLQLYLRWYLVISLLLCLSPQARAEESLPPWANDPILNCSTNTDNYIGNAQLKFSLVEWVRRGLCIRRGTDGGGPRKTFQCYSRLQNVISNNLNEIRKAEYNAAAGVLALLPTIGALLGTPTNEIWRLLTMIPFGGFLATACSFGGAILPVKVKDYESAFMKKNIKGQLRGWKSTLELPKNIDTMDQDRIKQRADILLRKVQEKLQSPDQVKVPKMYILVGLTGMSVLLASAQIAMVIVELGAVLPWWCISKWWVHLWYMMVILSAAIDNYVQLPFEKQWRLCLSDVGYDFTVVGGDRISNHLSGQKTEIENIKTALKQLKSLKAGTVRFKDRPVCHTEARNVLFVQVSVTSHSHNWSKTFTRSLSKITSIAVFIVGTACFASAQLLSIAMATFVLTCVLGAGVFGRAITSWIVAGIQTAEPMVHFVADNSEEAHYILARLFMIGPDDIEGSGMRPIQVEMRGHVFLDQRRITSRSPWPSRLLGILTTPYDIKAIYKKHHDNGSYDLNNLERPDPLSASDQPLLRPALTTTSTFGTDSSEQTSLDPKLVSRQSNFRRVTSNSLEQV